MAGSRMRRRALTAQQAGWIKWLNANTSLFQHQIAAAIDTNQGRVCEVLKGDRFLEALPTEPPEAILGRVQLMLKRAC